MRLARAAAAAALVFVAPLHAGPTVTITFDTIGMVGYAEPNLYVEDGYSFRIVPSLSVSNHLDGQNPVYLHMEFPDSGSGMMVDLGGRRFSPLAWDYNIPGQYPITITADDGREASPRCRMRSAKEIW